MVLATCISGKEGLKEFHLFDGAADIVDKFYIVKGIEVVQGILEWMVDGVGCKYPVVLMVVHFDGLVNLLNQ